MAPLTPDAPEWVPAALVVWNHAHDCGRVRLPDGRELAVAAGLPASLATTLAAGQALDVRVFGGRVVEIRSQG